MRLLLLILALAVIGANLFAVSTRMAIIGDYGADNDAERAVAEMVTTNFAPEFIVTVGDNNYLGAANLDRAVGKFYHRFIGNYSGSYGTGALSNRFFPALGNHDWDGESGFSAHTDYFTLPGNERYYELVRGPLHFFVINSDTHEPDGATATSAQAQWLSNRLNAAVSPWRIVIAQDPPHSSTSPTTRMRWPFKEWGASLVVSGHAHQYERLLVDGMPFIVNGAGGASLAAFGPTVAGSMVRYNASHGAMRVIATDTNLVCEFFSVANGGTLIDRFTRQSGWPLSVERQPDRVRLTWPSNAAEQLVLEATDRLAEANWQPISQPADVTGTVRSISLPLTNRQQFFRLRH